MAHDAPFPPNPMRPSGNERAMAIQLLTDAIAAEILANRHVDTDGSFNCPAVAEAIVDNPRLLVFSNNWLKDHEIQAIISSIRSCEVELTLWRGPDNPTQKKTPEPPKLRPASSPNPADEHTLVRNDDINRMNLELARLTRANETLDTEGRRLRAQIDHLAQWIVDNVDNEPSVSEGAVDTAIRIMRRLTEERNEHQIDTNKIERLAEWISKNIPAREQDWTGNPVDTAIGKMTKADEQIQMLRDEIETLRNGRDRLAHWMNTNIPVSIISKNSSVIDAAIMAMDELQRELKAERETTREEEEVVETGEKIRKAVTGLSEQDRQAETRRMVDEINEQSRRLAGKSEIPPQSIEDAKREAIKSRSKPTNRFSGVWSVETLLGELAGAASMCWAHVERAGEFDSTKAKKVVDEAIGQLNAIYLMQGANPSWIATVGDEETAEDRNAVAEANALNDAIWMAPGDAAKAFINDHQRVHILNEPDHGAVTNDLLKMVVEGIDTLTKTVVEIVGGPQDEYAVRAEAQRDVDEEATEDTTFDNGPRVTHDGTLPESFLAEAREPWVKHTDEANDRPQEPSSQEWRQKISGVLGVRPGEMNYDLDTAVNKIGELRKNRGARATGDEWRQSIAEALGRDDWASLGLAEAVTTIRDLRRLQSRW
ncbi:hypothetical protein SEA_BONUM_3 [Gordonia phage Bonum]|nr:hypothetical protein SEA_BONUM_3 [Gordonia phage Bonum]